MALLGKFDYLSASLLWRICSMEVFLEVIPVLLNNPRDPHIRRLLFTVAVVINVNYFWSRIILTTYSVAVIAQPIAY